MKNLIDNQNSESIALPLVILFLVVVLSLAGIYLSISPQNEIAVLYFLLIMLFLMIYISIKVFLKT